MAYEKRVCVMKQIKRGFSADGGSVTGAVYAERLGEELTLSLRLAGLAPVREGRYLVAVWADGQIFLFPFERTLHLKNAPSLAGGLGVLLAYVYKEPEAVAYGYCEGAPQEPQPLLSAIEAFPEKGRRREEGSKAGEVGAAASPFCAGGEDGNASRCTQEQAEKGEGGRPASLYGVAFPGRAGEKSVKK